MGTFTASLRAIGDVTGLPATVEIVDGKMIIAAGETAIGEWPLHEVDFEPIPTGYRIAAEGEQLLVELKDIDGFADALASNARKTRFRRKQFGSDRSLGSDAPATRASRSVRSAEPQAKKARVKKEKTPKVKEPRRERADRSRDTGTREDPYRPAETHQAAVPGGPSRFTQFLDNIALAAEKRWGALLPEWVFTRGVVLSLGVLLLLTLVLPGVMSIVFLVVGLLLVMFGGVAYSDEIVASKWLPGRTTPAHPLIGGIAMVILGVLVGMIAR